jgi:hypothetical protein
MTDSFRRQAVTIDLDARPRRADIQQRGPSADGSITVTWPDGRTAELNATAAALWTLCDGTTTVREIVAAAEQFFRSSGSDIESDILATLAYQAEMGLIHL